MLSLSGSFLLLSGHLSVLILKASLLSTFVLISVDFLIVTEVLTWSDCKKPQQCETFLKYTGNSDWCCTNINVATCRYYSKNRFYEGEYGAVANGWQVQLKCLGAGWAISCNPVCSLPGGTVQVMPVWIRHWKTALPYCVVGFQCCWMGEMVLKQCQVPLCGFQRNRSCDWFVTDSHLRAASKYPKPRVLMLLPVCILRTKTWWTKAM